MRLFQLLFVFVFSILFFIPAISEAYAKEAAWKTLCVKSVCEMFSEIRDAKKTVQSRIYIQNVLAAEGGKDSKKSKNDTLPVMFLSVPLGISLPAGILVSIDGKDKFKPLLLDCAVKEGCRAAFDLTGQILESLKKGKSLSVSVVDSKKKREITFTYKLSKFAKAFADFEKSYRKTIKK